MKRKIVVLGGGISGYGSAILAKKKGFDTFLTDMGITLIRKNIRCIKVAHQPYSHFRRRIFYLCHQPFPLFRKRFFRILPPACMNRIKPIRTALHLYSQDGTGTPVLIIPCFTDWKCRSLSDFSANRYNCYPFIIFFISNLHRQPRPRAINPHLTQTIYCLCYKIILLHRHQF